MIVDRQRPFDQIKMVANQLQKICQDPGQREEAIAWWKEMVASMPDFSFESLHYPPKEAKGRAWGYLAPIIYYLRNPGDSSFLHSCEEARLCWEKAYELDPNSYYQRMIAEVSPRR